MAGRHSRLGGGSDCLVFSLRNSRLDHGVPAFSFGYAFATPLPTQVAASRSFEFTRCLTY
jgi:hypothetical protein